MIKRDIILLIICFLLILVLFIFALTSGEKIYESKFLQLAGSLMLIVIFGIIVWRGAKYVPAPNSKDNPGASQNQVQRWATVLIPICMILGVAAFTCLLFYLKAFSNIIAPWRKP